MLYTNTEIKLGVNGGYAVPRKISSTFSPKSISIYGLRKMILSQWSTTQAPHVQVADLRLLSLWDGFDHETGQGCPQYTSHVREALLKL